MSAARAPVIHIPADPRMKRINRRSKREMLGNPHVPVMADPFSEVIFSFNSPILGITINKVKAGISEMERL
jgi:hypothetical protein